jgi:GTP-binding protein EngB required for normal cell division
MVVDPKLLRALQQGLPKSNSLVRGVKYVLKMDANTTVGGVIAKTAATVAAGAAAGAAVKTLPKLLKDAKPHLRKIRDRHTGPEILILGQERAGKSTLYKFLTTGRLGKEEDRTQRTKEDVNSGVCTCEWMTETGSMLLGFRNIGDRRGNGPFDHAKYLVEEQPHLAFIVLDISSPEAAPRLNESYTEWFDHFCACLNEDLLNRTNRQKQQFRKKLRNIIIILNKIDLLDSEISSEKIDRAKKFIETKMTSLLEGHLGYKIRHFPVIPLSLIKNPKQLTNNEELTNIVNRLS